MSSNIGVLAYGSLITDPGEELEKAIVDRIHDVETPFPVEFAHKSTRRDGAPTLVPVEERGAPVEARVLVLDEDVSLNEAKDMLYRRERHLVGHQDKVYDPDPSYSNPVLIKDAGPLVDLEHVLYTSISADIEPRTPERLAELAIDSATGRAGRSGDDGITYLQDALEDGIETPLSGEYRHEILDRTEASNLEEALTSVRRDA